MVCDVLNYKYSLKSILIILIFILGHIFNGVKFLRGNCGVSIMRSGEAMERGLRDCCRSMRIGKILIQTDEDYTKEAKVFYAKLPPDIENRKVLLMYPILSKHFSVFDTICKNF